MRKRFAECGVGSPRFTEITRATLDSLRAAKSSPATTRVAATTSAADASSPATASEADASSAATTRAGASTDPVAAFLASCGFDATCFPYVVKPCDNMGGRGCRMVNSLSEFLPAVEAAINNSRSGRAIFEEYMDGREFSIDSLVVNGNVTITGFAERHIYYPPYFIEMGHTMSAELTKDEYNCLRNEFVKAVHAL
ncbi:MAG: ATP-grasp domain-containing protein, partial [Treponemataceae bacterium]|nr:ATP-grasp domain-containing protein [Treponemataceae bacterium]